jgi:hypothetical protein
MPGVDRHAPRMYKTFHLPCAVPVHRPLTRVPFLLPVHGTLQNFHHCCSIVFIIERVIKTKISEIKHA